MKHHETNLKNHGNQPKTIVLRYVTNTGSQLTYMIKEPSRHQHRVPTDLLYVYIGTFGTLPTAGFRLNKNALPIPKLFRMCFRIGKTRLYGFFSSNLWTHKCFIATHLKFYIVITTWRSGQKMRFGHNF